MTNDKRILITGAAGLAGRWLITNLSEHGEREIFCTDLTAPKPDTEQPAENNGAPQSESTSPSCTWITGDLCDGSFTAALVRDVKPDEVYHFAGLLGNANPEKLTAVNRGGTERILTALIANGLRDTRVLVTSSSAVYGDKGETPVTEDMTLDGASNYSISKIAQEKTALEFFTKYGLPVIVSRGFNNIAPGEKETMFISRIAVQIVRIERGIERILHVGPLHSYRDYLDTRDLVGAYAALIEKGKPGETYNVCSGKAYRIEEIFNLLVDHARVKIDYEIINYDQSGNISYQCGCADKLRARTGWGMTRDIRNTVVEILDYWRSH
jgi:GDP-4-dehydro-6-deoxy-D-mannose reductase